MDKEKIKNITRKIISGIKCKKHPHYTGHKLPENQCPMCLNYYLKLHKRSPIKPEKVFKDKTQYQRKPKHPKKYFE